MEYLSAAQTKKFIVTLGIVSFALQYTWENLQCAPFFNYTPVTYMALDMLGAALSDVAVTYVVYAIVAFFSKSWKWIFNKWHLKQWIIMEGIALLSSISVELFAQTRNVWDYTDLAPLIPGLEISFVPVFQFLILFPLSFALTKFILKQKKI